MLIFAKDKLLALTMLLALGRAGGGKGEGRKDGHETDKCFRCFLTRGCVDFCEG